MMLGERDTVRHLPALARRALCGLALFCCALPVPALAQTPQPSADATRPAAPFVQAPGPTGEATYLELELEELMHMRVTSVSRKSQRISDAAAAVFVINQEDIRRSGVTTIADALRMVPGLDVARIDANKWAVSSRGFNGRFASKMLVLFDGRTVYTPLFSGVFWDRQDTALEDIERIEVIRGPGAALWGANAVNGVINIITRSAADTAGWLVSAGGGSAERGFGTARYGLQLGEESALRVYGKYTSRAPLDDWSGQEGSNGWTALRGGFRFDSELTPQNDVTLQGDIYKERVHETYLNVVGEDPRFQHLTPVFGANLLSRWKHRVSESADLELQLYYDHTDVQFGIIEELRDTWDLDFQNRFALTPAQEIIWGAALRYSHDSITAPTASFTMTPDSQGTYLLSSFLQDSITLLPERLRVILGSKFEVNSYTGFELQPNLRLIYTPNRQHTVWGAVSRAVRTPSRGEEDFSLYRPIPVPGVVLHLTGNDRLRAEELIAYELGYRVEPLPSLSADLALFYNRYRRLNIFRADPTPQPSPFPPQVAIPLTLGNFGRAETCGAELAADYKAQPWWRLRGAYTFLRFLDTDTEQEARFTSVEEESPGHQFSLRSSMDLPKRVELDLWLRYVSGLRFQGYPALPSVPIKSYFTLDCRVACKPWPGLELALVGQNLLQKRHREFFSQDLPTEATAVGRSVYGEVTWQF